MADDNNRGIHASGPAGDSSKMPDGFVASVGGLSFAKGGLGSTSTGSARQDVPGSGEVNPREQYSFTSTGEPGLLGSDQNDDLTDDNRPSLPNPEFSGESGTTNAGPQGDPLDWGSVAPYHNPDFGKWPTVTQSDPTASTGQ